MITTLLLDTDLAIVAAVTSTNVAEALQVLDALTEVAFEPEFQPSRIEKERTQTYVARERRLELADGDMRNRNTYFRGDFNDAGQLIACEKIVYGETEFRHDYRYHPDGRLARAEIDDGSGEPSVLDYPA